MRSALLLSLLAGCLAPRRPLPAPPVDAAWPAPPGGFDDPAPADPRAAADVAWREAFPDPRLQALIELALEHNRDLRTAALNIEQARALHRIQRSFVLPSVQGNAGLSVTHTPAEVSPVGQAFTIERYEVGVSVPAFELDFFGRLRNLTKAALEEYLATEEAFLSARIGLVGEVASAYLAERAAAEQLALAERALSAREQAYELSRQRFEAGVSSELDLRQAETLVASARVSVATLARQRGQARNALTLLVGTSPADLPEPRPLDDQGVVADLPPGLPSDLLTRRPDLRAAERHLRARRADIGAARAAFFPRVTLTASVGSASSELLGLVAAGTGAWALAPQLVQPLFQWGRNRQGLALAEVREDLAVVAYERAIQVAFREVADALVARATLDDQVAAQERLRDAQAARLALADQRYGAGLASYLEVLDAQRALFDAEQALVQARLLRLTNAVDLYRALGGGHAEPPTP